MPTNKKTCRECGSAEWYAREVDAKGGYGPDLLPLGWFSGAKFRIRVCGSCGLVEWFVPSKLLPDVKERFERET